MGAILQAQKMSEHFFFSLKHFPGLTGGPVGRSAPGHSRCQISGYLPMRSELHRWHIVRLVFTNTACPMRTERTSEGDDTVDDGRVFYKY